MTRVLKKWAAPRPAGYLTGGFQSWGMLYYFCCLFLVEHMRIFEKSPSGEASIYWGSQRIVEKASIVHLPYPAQLAAFTLNRLNRGFPAQGEARSSF